MSNLEEWYQEMKGRKWYLPTKEEQEAAPGDAQAGTTAPAGEEDSGTGAALEEGPAQESYLVTITGYHYHNSDTPGGSQGAQYVRDTLIANLRNMQVRLPRDDGQAEEMVSMEELGIRYPALIDPGRPVPVTERNPNVTAPRGGRGGYDDDDEHDEYQDEYEEEDEGEGIRRSVRPRQVVEPDEDAVTPEVSLLRFDLSGLPPYALLHEARLHLWVGSRSNDNPLTVRVYEVLRAWSEDEGTWWVARPGENWGEPGGSAAGSDRASVPLAELAANGQQEWISIDLMPLAQRWVDDVSSNQGVLLEGEVKTAVMTTSSHGLE